MAFYDDGYYNDDPNDIAESKEIKELKEIDREKTTIEDFDNDYWESDRTHDMYIKKFHGITVNKYTKETFGGCICEVSSQNDERSLQKSEDLKKKTHRSVKNVVPNMKQKYAIVIIKVVKNG